MKILIIEDEWLVAHFIADVAQSHDIDIAGIAQSYDEATEIIDNNSIDCAIVDINIKGSKHGIDVARFLKTRNIPFLFLTAYKDIETMKEATDLDPLSYLIKPVSEENLIAAFLVIKNKFTKSIPQKHPFTIDMEGMILKDGEMVSLSTSERIVMALLIKNHRNVVLRETFFEHLWDDPEEINEGTLRNVILKLRKKFDLQIENIKNVGYAFV
ncbi:MAG: DNA-binding response regulator [Sulfuricurvum sp.]|uniref:response regulator transcription factor n=1 Tax=Sulfuricurvum sp. TaxID=2025608 RepID=UPI0026326A09|nr:DNA-binding response regulator [Sulfuricurvum sp.]MDD2830060.1 DNA-binding response regulator [Sulfuricurvum sp.]MDD4950632.1 DNA-binding response regulator [Sulfuricurvum sp.]